MEQEPLDNTAHDDDTPKRIGQYDDFDPAGLALGMGVGVALGAAMGNISLGVALGAAVGVAFAVSMAQRKKAK